MMTMLGQKYISTGNVLYQAIIVSQLNSPLKIQIVSHRLEKYFYSPISCHKYAQSLHQGDLCQPTG